MESVTCQLTAACASSHWRQQKDSFQPISLWSLDFLSCEDWRTLRKVQKVPQECLTRTLQIWVINRHRIKWGGLCTEQLVKRIKEEVQLFFFFLSMYFFSGFHFLLLQYFCRVLTTQCRYNYMKSFFANAGNKHCVSSFLSGVKGIWLCSQLLELEGLLPSVIAAFLHSVTAASFYWAKSILTAGQMLLVPVSRTLVSKEHLVIRKFCSKL